MGKSPSQLTRSTPKMRVPRPAPPWLRIFAVVLSLSATVGFIWLVQFYANHALYNISLVGTRIDNKTLVEIENEALVASEKLKITFKNGNTTITPTLDEIGLKIDMPASAKKAFEARRGRHFLDDIQLWRPFKVSLQLQASEPKLKEYLARTFPEVYEAPTSPGLKYNPEIEQFDMVPGRPGAGFDANAILLQILEAAHQPRELVFSASEKPVEPTVTDTTAVYTQDEVNKRLRLRLDFLYEDKLVYFPEPAEIASWCNFTPNNDTARLDIMYDKQKIIAFLRTKVEKSLNTFFGSESAEPTETDERLKVTEVDALAEDIMNALRANEPIEKEIEAATVGASPNEVAP